MLLHRLVSEFELARTMIRAKFAANIILGPHLQDTSSLGWRCSLFWTQDSSLNKLRVLLVKRIVDSDKFRFI